MRKYLLDTNIVISMFRNRHNVRGRILETGTENCYISEITVAELFYGASKSGRQENFDDVENLLKKFTVVPIFPALRLYAENKAKLEKTGRSIDDFDLLIGSSAVFNDMVAVTNNTKHFERIPNIRLEDWSEC